MNRAREIVAALALALLVGVGVGAQPAWAGQPFLFGAYTGGITIEQFEAMVGHTVALDDHLQTFSQMPKRGVADDIAAGRTPMISWTSLNGTGGSVFALDILNGVYDQQLDAQADAYAALGGTVLIEWQPEMTDNPRNSIFFTGVALDQWGPTYIEVWIYIHNIFVARGATNAQWVWSPGGNAYVTRKNGLIVCQPYFPGTAYVDWMGLHSFNKSDTPESYDANPQFLAFYKQAPTWAPGKPLIHGQTGATNTTDAQREWIATAQSSLKSEFPLVSGFVYFNENGHNPRPGYSEQYTLSGAGLTAYQAMAADPYFQ